MLCMNSNLILLSEEKVYKNLIIIYFTIRYMLKKLKKKRIQSVKDKYDNSINESAFLDILLVQIRGKTISYSSYRKRKNKIEKNHSSISRI